MATSIGRWLRHRWKKATSKSSADYRVDDRDNLIRNIKTLGYQMALQLSPRLLDIPRQLERQELKSKATRQADIESSWFAYWCSELKIRPVYHRKIWEYCYLLQTLNDRNLLVPGTSAIGFACGEEPIPSYLASLGVSVLATDLAPDQVVGKGWAETGQHSSSLDKLFYQHLVDRDNFERLVNLQYVDMNAIPDTLSNFDFCWSICSLEHLGSITKGLTFIENSLKVLRIGGTAIHTTEFNINNSGHTIDNYPTVLFQRRHFESVAQRLIAQGHYVAPLDFDCGQGPIDNFVDLPPFFGEHCPPELAASAQNPATAHLKLSLDGYPCTCFGFTIVKGGLNCSGLT